MVSAGKGRRRRNRGRRATAAVGKSRTIASSPGDPGSIPRTGRERRTRRCSLSASIHAGQLQSSVASSAATADTEELGGAKEGEREGTGGEKGCGEGSSCVVACLTSRGPRGRRPRAGAQRHGRRHGASAYGTVERKGRERKRLTVGPTVSNSTFCFSFLTSADFRNLIVAPKHFVKCAKIHIGSI